MPEQREPIMQSPWDTLSSLTYREATRLGDLILSWKEDRLALDYTMATDKERKKVASWLKKHHLPEVPDNGTRAHVDSTAAKLRVALKEWVDQEVGEKGYAVVTIGKWNRGKVLYPHDKVIPADTTEIVKVPQVRGG